MHLDIEIAIGWPVHELLRQAIRQAMGAIPIIVPGSVQLPCSECAMPLAVGPRTLAAIEASDPRMPLMCPWCVERATKGFDPEVRHLGNPDSRLE